MRSLNYQSSTGGSLGFEGPVYGETMPGLLGRAWDYSLSSRGISGLAVTAREITVTVKVHDSPESVDRMRALFDADMQAGTPGLLVADGEWKARAWIPKSDVQSVTPTMAEIQLTIVLHDGLWRRETTVHVMPRSDQSDAQLDHPFDYPHDYAGMPLSTAISNPASSPMPIRLTVYGPALNPTITIGGNRYEVDTDVPAGSRLVIDGASSPKTVTLIGSDGSTANRFAQAVRGTGLGSGRYIFQPLPPGLSQANGSGFEYDLTLCEERTAPPAYSRPTAVK